MGPHQEPESDTEPHDNPRQRFSKQPLTSITPGASLTGSNGDDILAMMVSGSGNVISGRGGGDVFLLGSGQAQAIELTNISLEGSEGDQLAIQGQVHLTNPDIQGVSQFDFLPGDLSSSVPAANLSVHKISSSALTGVSPSTLLKAFLSTAAEFNSLLSPTYYFAFMVLQVPTASLEHELMKVFSVMRETTSSREGQATIPSWAGLGETISQVVPVRISSVMRSQTKACPVKS
ncbi:hypothetical protein BV96_04670 [Sphingomonas paucimobilis]|nr:hypothetical protein BV96_04670 [Sphingomonas paucimobilis]